LARSPEQGADLGQVLDRIEIVDQLADRQLGGFPDSANADCSKPASWCGGLRKDEDRHQVKLIQPASGS
jgi:hypothetical protein